MNDYSIKEDMAPQLPTIDHGDHEGDVLVTNPDGSSIHVHYSLIEPWMIWQPLGDDTGKRHVVASARHQWTSDYSPSLSLADEDHEVMILHDMIVRYIDYSLVPPGARWCPTLAWYLEQHGSGNLENLADAGADAGPPKLEPLTFTAISRSFGPHGEHIIDAVTSDGTAWYRQGNGFGGYIGPWKRHEVPDARAT